MQLKFAKPFERSIAALRSDSMRRRVFRIAEQVIEASDLREIPNLKKLQGHPAIYRIRVGDYRIGVLLEGSLVIFAAFDHRKNIYHRFP